MHLQRILRPPTDAPFDPTAIDDPDRRRSAPRRPPGSTAPLPPSRAARIDGKADVNANEWDDWKSVRDLA